MIANVTVSAPAALRHRRAKSTVPAVLRWMLPAALAGFDTVQLLAGARELRDRCSREVIYAITSLPADKLDAADLLKLSRDHWQIENCLFHVRDVTFSEDTATSRTGSGPANLATIRAAIIAAIKDAGYLHIPEGRRDHTTPAETLRLHGLD